MKTAIYIVEGVVQIVLTPENKHEEEVVTLLDQDDKELKTYRGSFYECQGGWFRQEGWNNRTDKSFILRIEDKKHYKSDRPDPLPASGPGEG